MMFKYLQAFVLLCFCGSALAAGKPAEKLKSHKVASAIGAELRASKTIGEWINKSSAKNKVFRRKYFSKHMNDPMPQVIVSGPTVLVFEKKKKKIPSVLRVEEVGGQMQFAWNGFDITKPKNKQLEQWFRQKFPKYKNTAQVSPNPLSPLDFFISEAYAQSTMPRTITEISQRTYVDPNVTSYWTAMMASMSAEDWENVNLYDRFGPEDAPTLMNAGILFRDQYKMTCSSDGKAQFDFPLSDLADQPLRITASYDGSAKLARLAIAREQQDSSLPMPMGEVGRIAYRVGEKDSSFAGMNIGQVNFYDPNRAGATPEDKFTLHDSLRDANFLEGVYTVANRIEGMELAPPSGDAMNATYDTVQGMVAAADFARACCANSMCRSGQGAPTGNTPPGTVEN